MTETALKPGWRKWRFNQIATNVKDRIDNPSESAFEYYVGLEHIDPDSLKLRRWGSPSDVEATKLIFRKGDIIFGRRRVYQRKVAVAEFDGICSAHALVLRAKPDVILPSFLPFFMQSELFMERAKSISVGSLSPTINWRTLAKEEFVLPPLNEQGIILHALKSANQNENDYIYAIESALKLAASIRLEKFNPSKYETRPLKDFCSKGKGIQIGPFGAQLHQSDYVDEGVPVVMPANMRDDRIDTSEISFITEEKAESLLVHRVQPGDVLLPRRGELNRRAYVEDSQQGWLCGTGSIRVRAEDENLRKALFHSLSSAHCVRWMEGNAVGTTMLNLNTKIVRNIPIALPPNKDVMEEIVSTLDSLEESIVSLRQRMSEAQNLKRKVLSQVFIGV